MKIKTADLIGPALDWAVAKCLGVTPIAVKKNYSEGWLLYPHSNATIPLEYSSKWSQGGPIMDKEGIYFVPLPDKGIRAFRFINGEYLNLTDCWGENITRCVVAMRCFVASRLGDEVDIPEELL